MNKGLIVGEVFRNDGSPAEKCDVRCYRFDFPENILDPIGKVATKTDAKGKFALEFSVSGSEFGTDGGGLDSKVWANISAVMLDMNPSTFGHARIKIFVVKDIPGMFPGIGIPELAEYSLGFVEAIKKYKLTPIVNAGYLGTWNADHVSTENYLYLGACTIWLNG